MRAIVPLLCIAVLFAPVAAGASGEAAPVTVESTVTGDEYRYYPDAGVVGFPAIRSRGEVVKYRNTSLQEFARWEANEVGVERVREVIADNLELDRPRGITSGVTSSGIEISYVQYENESRQQPYTYEELVAATPSAVQATIHFRGETVSTTVPVTVDTTRPARTQEAALGTADGAGSRQPEDMPDNRMPEILTGAGLLAIGAASLYWWRRRR